MSGKSKGFIISFVVIAVIIVIIIIVNAKSNHKLSETGAKLAAEKKATLNFLQPTPTPPDFKIAQEIIESDPDVAAYMKETGGQFKFVVRYKRTLCLHELEINGKHVFEFPFKIDYSKKTIKHGHHSIFSISRAMKLVAKIKYSDRISKSNNFFVFLVVAEEREKEIYTVMVEEYISTDFDNASKRVSQRFFDVDLEKNTVIETEVPT